MIKPYKSVIAVYSTKIGYTNIHVPFSSMEQAHEQLPYIIQSDAYVLFYFVEQNGDMSFYYGTPINKYIPSC